MKNRKQMEKKLRQHLEQNILLPEEEKNFWLSKISTLPDEILLNVLQFLESKNKILDEYIQTALKNDPDREILSELKTEISKLKRETTAIDESHEQGSAEEKLSKMLKDL